MMGESGGQVGEWQGIIPLVVFAVLCGRERLGVSGFDHRVDRGIIKTGWVCFWA